MEKNELLNKWNELTNTWTDKEAKLESFIQKWLDDDSILSNESVQHVVDTTTEQIEQLKTMANEAINSYTKICHDDALREERLKVAKSNVRKEFQTSPDELIINGGILSSNASETHLIGRQKTEEELEQERQSLIAEIRSRVANKQLTLAEASKLKDNVNCSYNYSQQNQDMENNKQR